MGMPLFGACDELAVQIIQGCKQRNGPVSLVVMCLGANLSHAKR